MAKFCYQDPTVCPPNSARSPTRSGPSLLSPCSKPGGLVTLEITRQSFTLVSSILCSPAPDSLVRPQHQLFSTVIPSLATISEYFHLYDSIVSYSGWIVFGGDGNSIFLYPHQCCRVCSSTLVDLEDLIFCYTSKFRTIGQPQAT